MRLDLPAGKTEIDHYNGYLLEEAGDYPALLNRLNYKMIKRMELAKTSPAIDHLVQLERDYLEAMARIRAKAA